MKSLVGFVRRVDAMSEWLGWMAQMVVPITIVVGFGNVVLRYVGEFTGVKLTSNAVIETQWYLYTLIFLLGFSYILKNGINVRVDFWFAEQSLKTKAWIDVIGHSVALIPFCFLALWATWRPVLVSWGLRPDGSWGTWEMSPDPSGLPRAPIKTVIIIAFVTLLLQAIAEMIKLIAVLRDESHYFDIIDRDAPIRIE